MFVYHHTKLCRDMPSKQANLTCVPEVCICSTSPVCLYVPLSVWSQTDGPGSISVCLLQQQKNRCLPLLQVLVGASLEPYGARRMLPCFDFPNYKANFSISIQAPANLIVLSNMAEAKAQPGIEPGTVLHTFETTPKMSTYLIGVTVGHMVSTSAISSSGMTVSVWSVPSLAKQHSVALQVTFLPPSVPKNYRFPAMLGTY